MALAWLAGCSGSSSPVAAPGALPQNATEATHAMPQWKAQGLARAACPQVVGKPTCLVLTEKGIQPACAGSSCGWAPIDFQTRYNLPVSQGSGQIVAIVDAGDNPDVGTSLATYRTEFGLGTANFTKYNQDGQQSNYPPPLSGWTVEIALDVEMVSASCPLCTIYLVEANSSDASDLEAAETEAVSLGAHIVSNSWGCLGSISCVDVSDFDTPGVAYVAATGDSGLNQVGAPAAFASVAAIGGTQLAKSGSTYTETVWDSGGGGCVTGVPKPKWQHDKVCTYRATADASAEAGCSPGVAEYDSYDGGWFGICGTSAASPLAAAVFGLAGDAKKQKGGRTFWRKTHHKYLYDVCATSCLFSTYSYGGGWGSPDGIRAF